MDEKGSIVRIEPDDEQRVLVIGDLHGCFVTLAEGLQRVSFDPQKDLLLGLGDLIDRGPNSLAAVLALEDGLISVRGNHEEVLRTAIANAMDNGAAELMGDCWTSQWWLDIPRSDWSRWHEALEGMPHIVEVSTAYGKVGLVHACPPASEWEEGCRAVEEGDPDTVVKILWGAPIPDQGERQSNVNGVRAVITGHTVVQRPTMKDNVLQLDTGAGMPGGSLSVARIDCQPIRATSWPLAAHDRQYIEAQAKD